MELLAITIGLLGTSAILAYIGNQFKTGSEGGTKYAAVMKILFNAISFTTLLFVPAAGLIIADTTGIADLTKLMSAFFVPVGFLYIVFVFYLIWEYLSDIIRVMSGSQNQFETDEFK